MSELNNIEGLEHEVVYPKENDYHGHPNYFKIYLALLLLFAISLVASELQNFMLMIVIVFTVSTMKSILVLNYFMHLKWEPIPLQIIIYMCLFTLATLILGVYFDVSAVPKDVFKM
ncbi:MAG: cytochrome C oxidase subunit IV family protein [Saprospiraceae bacterium]